MTATVRRTAIAACKGVTVVYVDGDSRRTALADVELTIEPGERLALWGSSGSGKTTFLHVLGGLLEPTEGTVEWEGKPLSTLDTAARAKVRAPAIAYVFQGANLMPHFTVFENLAFAATVSRREPDPRLAPRTLLELVGLRTKAESLPSELSGGEAQRVAVARALAQGARLVLCDEPTGHLDSDTGERVLALIEALQREFGFALVLATHDAGVASRLEREVELRDGRVVRTEVHV